MSTQPLSAEIAQPGRNLEKIGSLSPREKDKKLRSACEGFESIFIQKMWEQMQNTVPKEGLMHSRDEKTWQSMYDQELAKEMTRAGGIGLADMMYEQLSRNLRSATACTASNIPMAPQAFVADAAPLIPQPAPQNSHEKAEADPIYSETPLRERGDVDENSVQAALTSLRSEQERKMQSMQTASAAPAAAAQGPVPAPVPAASGSMQGSAAVQNLQAADAPKPAPLRADAALSTRMSYSSNIPGNAPQQLYAMQTNSMNSAAPAGQPAASGTVPPLSAVQMNGSMPAKGVPQTVPVQNEQLAAQAGVEQEQSASPRVTRTRHTSNTGRRSGINNVRTSGSSPQQQLAAGSSRTSRRYSGSAGSGDIRTLNLQGESMNLTSSASQSLLAQQVYAQQQEKYPDTPLSPSLQQGLNAAGLGGIDPQTAQGLLAQRIAQQTERETLVPPLNTSPDQMNMQVSAMRHDQMLQQAQAMAPAGVSPIAPLRR